jgi:ferric-dicitrate binding protein FerR (iron transport regulator)
MRTENNGSIEELLPRYCNGTLTEEENRRVQEWMEESEENRQTVKHLLILYLAADVKNIMESANTEKALADVSRRMNGAEIRKVSFFTWLQRIAAVLFIPLSVAYGIQLWQDNGAKTRMIEIRTNPGMTASVTLPDGSTACLNSETTLKYPSRFTGNVREVSMEGEVFFEVGKDPKRKFRVSTPHQAGIEVLGTHFNIDAYEKDNTVSTTLLEGKVRFHYRKEGRPDEITLSPGQKLVYDVTTAKATPVKTNGESEISWKDGRILFANTPMREALRMLEKRYNVSFIIRNDALLENSFTGTFTHQRLERILEYFKISSNINSRYTESDDIRKEKSEIEIY